MKALKREAIVALVILVATVFILFPATYFVGTKTLGDYGSDGTLGRYLGSLFSELGQGNPAIWFFTLTPLLAISILRLGIFSFRRI